MGNTGGNFFGGVVDLGRCAAAEGNSSGVASSSCCAAAEGNSLSLAPAARDSSLAREPFCCTVGTVRHGKEIHRPKKFTYYLSLSIHGSLLRELPAVVADTAKAEGVAIGRTETALLQPTPNPPP